MVSIKLMRANALLFLLGCNSVVHGLVCSAGTSPYAVQAGDYLFAIAGKCATTLPDLEQANPQITNPDSIDIGQLICVPSACSLVATPTVTPTVTPTITPTVTPAASSISAPTGSPTGTPIGTDSATPTASPPSGTASPATTSPTAPSSSPPSSTSPCSNTDFSQYKLKSGDTISAIATSCSMSLPDLESNNTQIPNYDNVPTGLQICVPKQCSVTASPNGQAASSGGNKGHILQVVYSVIAAVLGASIPVITWLIVSYSYRQDKLMIVREVGEHATEADLGSEASDDSLSWDLRSVSSRRNSFDPLIQLNPMTAHSAAIAAHSDLQNVARQIAKRSLRRWDGMLGFRAGRDGLGNSQGVWRDRFEGVRFAVLLLAMRKLNSRLQTGSETSQTGSLLMTWRASSWSQRNDLVNQLAQLMQNISEAEAQDLPDKDPDVAGMYDNLFGLLNKCYCCTRRGHR